MKKEYLALRILFVAVTLVLVASTAVFSAFSWYDRTQRANEDGYLLNYTQTGKVNNATGVTVVTYAGTVEDGAVTYSETPLSGAVDVKAGQVNYFKSVITDTANAGGALVSLYLKDFTYNSSMGEKVFIGIVNPEKTYKEYSSVASGNNRVLDTFCLEDNIIVPNNGTVEVQWYVVSATSFTGAEALNPGTMYIAYN